MSDEDDPSSGGGTSTASYVSANTGPSTSGSSSSTNGAGGGSGVFNTLFGFQMPGSNGKVNSKVGDDPDHNRDQRSGPGSAVVAAAAAAGPSGNYSPQAQLGPQGYTNPQHRGSSSSGLNG